VNQIINILGLGLDQFFWKKFCFSLEDMFAKDQIDVKFDHIKFKWSRFKENSLNKLADIRPDFIFTTLDIFKNFVDFESFFQTYLSKDLIDYPYLFLIERKPHKVINSYIKTYPYQEIEFRRLNRIQIKSADWFAEDQVTLLTEIAPTPHITFSAQECCLNKEDQVCFAPWSAVESISWNGLDLKPKSLCERIGQETGSKIRFKDYKGCLSYKGKFYLSPGLYFRDIIRLETDNIPIDHVIGYRQVKQKGIDYKTVLFKIKELARSRCSLYLNDNLYQSASIIKANTPITVTSDYPPLHEAFKRILLKNGFSSTITADQLADSADRFLIGIRSDNDQETPFSFTVNLKDNDLDIRTINRISEVDPDFLVLEEESFDLLRINKQNSQTQAQLQKLEDQLKALSNSKALDDQQRYMDMIAGNKMDILKNLVEISETWNEQDCDVAVARNENVLIVFDSVKQAETIDQQLGDTNNKTFLNITKQVNSLESLVKLDIECLEIFLHDGIIICSVTTKALLQRKFKEFEDELSLKQYPPLGEAIDNLRNQISNCEKRLKNLSFLAFYAELNKVYERVADDLFASVQAYYRDLEFKRYSSDKIKKICMISEDEKSCNRIQRALESTFMDTDKVEFCRIHKTPKFAYSLPIEINENEEVEDNKTDLDFEEKDVLSKLAGYNARQLSQYFQSIWNEIGFQDFNLFVINGDSEIVRILISHLKQEKSKYKETPIIQLASGKFNIQQMIELTKDGVKVLYQDQYRKENQETLTKMLKSTFAVF